MIKLVFTLKRKPDMSPEDFQDYWYNSHGPLVREYEDLLKIRRYVQVHLTESDLNQGLVTDRGSEAAFYDGVAELWWDSEEDLLGALDTPEAQEALAILIEDEAKFIDLPNSPLWMGEEKVVIG